MFPEIPIVLLFTVLPILILLRLVTRQHRTLAHITPEEFRAMQDSLNAIRQDVRDLREDLADLTLMIHDAELRRLERGRDSAEGR